MVPVLPISSFKIIGTNMQYHFIFFVDYIIISDNIYICVSYYLILLVDYNISDNIYYVCHTIALLYSYSREVIVVRRLTCFILISFRHSTTPAMMINPTMIVNCQLPGVNNYDFAKSN